MAKLFFVIEMQLLKTQDLAGLPADPTRARVWDHREISPAFNM